MSCKIETQTFTIKLLLTIGTQITDEYLALQNVPMIIFNFQASFEKGLTNEAFPIASLSRDESDEVVAWANYLSRVI